MTATPVARDEYRLLVDGEWVPGAGSYEVVNPATGAVVGHAPDATVDQARDAAAAARAAQPGWAARPDGRALRPARRGRRPPRGAPRRDGPAHPGRDRRHARRSARAMQVPVAVDRFRRYARPEDTTRALEPQITPHTPLAPGTVLGCVVVRQPVGVVGLHHALQLPARQHGRQDRPRPRHGQRGRDQAGAPGPARHLRDGGDPRGGRLPARRGEPGERGRSRGRRRRSSSRPTSTWSASPAAQRSVAGSSRPAPRTMKRQLMELGGKGPCVVFDDADLDAAIQAVGSTFAFHAGQICTAPTRLIAHRSVFDEVVDRLAKFAGALKAGRPARRRHARRPGRHRRPPRPGRGLRRSAAARRAPRSSFGGDPARPPRRLRRPDAARSATNDMCVAREEAFGPVVVAVPFDDEDEAVAIANDSEYGLFGYVFTGDSPRGHAGRPPDADGHRSASTRCSRTTRRPFGGFKMSGVGRDRGSFGPSRPTPSPRPSPGPADGPAVPPPSPPSSPRLPTRLVRTPRRSHGPLRPRHRRGHRRRRHRPAATAVRRRDQGRQDRRDRLPRRVRRRTGDRRRRAVRGARDRRRPHALRPAAHLRALRHLVVLPRRDHGRGRQLRVLDRADQGRRPRLHHPDVRPGRGHVAQGAGRRPVGLRDLPRVPRRAGRAHRREHGVLRRPLRRPPLGHGRRLLRARGHGRRGRRDGGHRRRRHGRRRLPGSRRATPPPTGTPSTGPSRRGWRRCRSSRRSSPWPDGPTPAPSPTCRSARSAA